MGFHLYEIQKQNRLVYIWGSVYLLGTERVVLGEDMRGF